MNKLIKSAMMMASVVAMLCIVGCGGSAPDSVAQDFISCLKSADIDGMQKCSTGELKQGWGMTGGSDRKMMGDYIKNEFADKKFEIGQSEIDGDKAKVPVKINCKNRSMRLVKVDGEWKVTEFDFVR